jgi:hypothetical protein
MKGYQMKLIVFGLFLILFIIPAQGQVSVPNSDQATELGQTVFGFGFSGGAVSGFGLSFKHHLPSALSYQIVAGVIKADNKVRYNFGGEGQYDLIRSEKTRFFACGGLGYFYSGESGENELSGPFRAGLGLGIETSTSKSIGVAAELLFSYFSDGTILPLPQLSAHYYFY